MNIKKTAADQLLTWPLTRPLVVALAAGMLAVGIPAPSNATPLSVQPGWFHIVGHMEARKAPGTADQPGTAITDKMKDWPYGPGCRSHARKGATPLALQRSGDTGPKVYP